MKRTRIIGAAVLLGAATCSNTVAGMAAVSADFLKKTCASYVDTPSSTFDGMCIGYVVGVASVMQFMNAVCLPERSTHAQAVLVVQKYLHQHPEKLHLNADELVFDALQQAFPCTAAPAE